MPSEPTVFVVDDDPAVLRSVVGMLNAEGFPAESFERAENFLAHIDHQRPGCLVVDLRMPGMTGIDLLQRLQDGALQRPTVVISGYAEIGSVVQSMQLGAITVLEKPFHPADFLKSVQQALDADSIQRDAARRQQASAAKLRMLTDGEQAVLQGLARQLTIEEIAQDLGCSKRTVDLRRASLMERLGVTSRVELLELIRTAKWT